MFTVEQIHAAHEKVKSGADFPRYIQDIKQLGVIRFETFVVDSHTAYFGPDNYETSSTAVYDALQIAAVSNPEKFKADLKPTKGRNRLLYFLQRLCRCWY